MTLMPKYEKADRTTNHKGNRYSQHVPPVRFGPGTPCHIVKVAQFIES
jgi:hypothetical protein